MKRSPAIQILQEAGVSNPLRAVRLIREVIEFLALDLTDLTVLTEAASGPYAVTPVIAELAGAKRVLALTGDSRYASTDEVIRQTRALEALCGTEGGAEIQTERSIDLFAQADIVTNLGFVRPIDAEVVAAMKPTAVVPLMCEAWEYRPEDVDLEACRAKGVEVLGTNEDYPGLDVFAYSGSLVLKMLLQAQIELHKSKVVVVSSDRFGAVIKDQLGHCAASVNLVAELRSADSRATLVDADVLVIADYSREDVIVGPDGDLTSLNLADLSPTITVIQFAGRIEPRTLSEHGIVIYPQEEIGAHRMALTLAELGPRPVIELHAAGLKIGEMAAQARFSGMSWSETFAIGAGYSGLVQDVR